MSRKFKFRQESALDTFIYLSGCVLLCIGFISMLDWLLSLDPFSRLHPDHRTSSTTSSAFFIVSGLFLLSIIRKPLSGILRSIALVILTFFSILGLIQSVCYILQFNHDFDFLLNLVNVFLDNFPLLQMSPFGGILIFVCSLAFWLKFLGRERIIALNIVCSLGIIAGLSGFVALLGFLFGTPSLYSGNLIRLAPTTAIGYLFLGGVLVTLAGANTVSMRPFIGSGASARVLRVFLPLIISILLFQGILNLLLERYFNVNPALLLVLLTVFSIILSVWVILYVTKIIFQFADKAEKERIVAESTLAANEKKYRYLFENNPQPMWVYDLETLAFLEVNDSAVHHYGYSKKEFLNMTLKDIRPVEDIDALMQMSKTPIEIYRVGDWRHKKKNGEIIFVEINSHGCILR